MRPIVQNLLLAYAVVATTGIGITLAVAQAKQAPATPGTLTVQQIRIVEPDGTLRTVISNKTALPGVIIGGKTFPHPRGQAGILFFDDEGSEIGGLLYNGSKGKDGKVANQGNLSFDRYQQDQALQLANADDGDTHTTGLKVFDRADTPLDVEGYSRAEAMPAGPARDAAYARLNKADGAARRLFVGRSPDRDAALALNDAQGRTRLIVAVSADGEATIRFMDERGKVTRTIDGASLK